MSVETVREYLSRFALDGRVREYEASCATVALAAEAIGCDENRIAKSLTFKVKDEPVLIVIAGDGRVDNAKYKAQFGVKATMLKGDEVEKLTGHAIGGVCPFALKRGVRVFLDESLKRFETVFPACGSSNSVIELSLDELEKTAGAEGWIDICKETKEATL